MTGVYHVKLYIISEITKNLYIKNVFLLHVKSFDLSGKMSYNYSVKL